MKLKKRMIKAMRNTLEELGWEIGDTIDFICTKCDQSFSSFLSTPNFCSDCGGKLRKKVKHMRCNDELWAAISNMFEVWGAANGEDQIKVLGDMEETRIASRI
jgi:hypothetical protein